MNLGPAPTAAKPLSLRPGVPVLYNGARGTVTEVHGQVAVADAHGRVDRVHIQSVALVLPDNDMPIVDTVGVIENQIVQLRRGLERSRAEMFSLVGLGLMGGLTLGFMLGLVAPRFFQ